MKTQFLTFLILVIAVTVSSIHIQSHTPLIAAPSAKRKHKIKLPVQKNETRQLLFLDKFHKITNEASFIQRTLQMSFPKQYPQLLKVTKKLIGGVRAVKKGLMKYSLIIPLEEKRCFNSSTYNRSQLNRYIQFTQTYRDIVSKEINKTKSELDNLKDAYKNITKLINVYFSHLKRTLDEQYCDQIKKANEQKVINNILGIYYQNNTQQPKDGSKDKIYFKNNLDVPNWYYGTTNQVKYRAYLNQRSTTLNLVICPPEKPFVRDDEQQCFNCDKNAIYNLGEQKCESCKPGEMLNVGKGVCEPCYGEKFIIKHQFVCKACVIEAEQLFNPVTQKCYKCGTFNYLDATNRTCKPISCPSNKPRFNRQLQNCQPCGINQSIDPSDPTKCIENPIKNVTTENKTVKVVSDKSAPTEGTLALLNAKTESPKFNKPLNNSQKVEQTSNSSLTESQNKKPTTQQKPITTPSSINDAGKVLIKDQKSETQTKIECQSDKPLYNESSKQCVECPKEQTYNNLTKKCEKPIQQSKTNPPQSTTLPINTNNSQNSKLQTNNPSEYQAQNSHSTSPTPLKSNTVASTNLNITAPIAPSVPTTKPQSRVGVAIAMKEEPKTSPIIQIAQPTNDTNGHYLAIHM